ncbi:sulfite oxidase [Dermacentor andersoni]|uniref:sulfite oxidase n=1 Tax=Dermacentor andersoni TaxID=34620 RepID=UPI002155CDFF|nr:sulfite oxidase-like [Dermacentor andersoni]
MALCTRYSRLMHVFARSAAQPKSTLHRVTSRLTLACPQGRTDDDEFRRSSGRAWALLGGGITLGLFSYWTLSPVHAKQETKADEAVDGLPVYTADEVAKHDTKATRIWISFKCGVYDVTDFVDEHPGGDKILLGAGGGIDPFWNIYAVHKTPEILALLETFRIGNLAPEDVGAASAGIEDPYLLDPKRHRDLKPASTKPFNAEPPLGTLADNYRTPNELFYVRNHMPVPYVDPKDYVLEIEDPDGKCHELTLDDIKTKFSKVSVTSVIQCAGNRRSEQNKIKKVKGLDWGPCAIGNATWSGARLVDVLHYLGVDLSDERIQHIVMEGLDTDPTGTPYGSSFPANKGLDPKGDVLLAYEMNGKELPRDHGFPLRAIVPGIVGARNVKWLSRIQLSPAESESHWQQNDYKGFCPSTDWDTVDFKSAPAIQELPITSVVCRPLEGEVLAPKDGKIHVKGYAWSGGGRKVVRVDVSADGGQNWIPAQLESEDTSLFRAWAWTLWKLDLPVPKGADKLEIVCKAVDSSYNSQPEGVAGVWNLRGVLNNAWYRVHVRVKQP